jgi:hypothetical protein
MTNLINWAVYSYGGRVAAICALAVFSTAMAGLIGWLFFFRRDPDDEREVHQAGTAPSSSPPHRVPQISNFKVTSRNKAIVTTKIATPQRTKRERGGTAQ